MSKAPASGENPEFDATTFATTPSGRQKAWERFRAMQGSPSFGVRGLHFSEIKEGVGTRDNLPLLEVWFRDHRGGKLVWVPALGEVCDIFFKAVHLEGTYRSGWESKKMEACRQVMHRLCTAAQLQAPPDQL